MHIGVPVTVDRQHMCILYRVLGLAGCSSRVLGQAGCSSRVFAEHPRNRVLESGEQGACGVLESGEQGVCGVLGTPSKQGACF